MGEQNNHFLFIKPINKDTMNSKQHNRVYKRTTKSLVNLSNYPFGYFYKVI